MKLHNHTYEELQQYFNDINFTELKYPKLVDKAISILNDEIPFKMRLFIAINECGTLVSNLGNSIRLNSKTMVTTNMQNIMFSKSGTSKDSAVNTIRANFKEAYKILQNKAKVEAIQIAKEKCAEANKGNTDNWRDYYKDNSRSLFPALSTPEGMLAQMDVLQNTSVLAYNMKIGELGSELKANPMGLLLNLKLMAEGYDLGIVPSNLVKTKDLQTAEINGLNINTLMFSSIDTLLRDKSVRDRFVDYMTIQGTRRSMLYMNTSPKSVKEYNSLIDYLNEKNKYDNNFEKNVEALSKMSQKIVRIIPTGKDVFIDFEPLSEINSLDKINTRHIYELYKLYNSYRALEVPEKYKLLQISTEHLHWKALKLAGLFTMMSGKMVIEPEHMLQAISITEYYNNDVKLFQIEVDKEVYERIVDFIKLRAVNGKLQVTKHNLVKEGFIPQSMGDAKIKELADLCTDSDPDGIYKFINGKLAYKRISVESNNSTTTITESTNEKKNEDSSSSVEEKEETKKIPSTINIDNNKPIKLSYKVYKLDDGTPVEFDDPKDFKEYRNKNSEKGWKNITTKFESYVKLLSSNVSVSPYWFSDGKNSKGEFIKGYRTLDTIISTTDTIILDVDDSILTIEEMHELLEDYTHVIATTSNKDNPYKFRIVLRLDREIDLTPQQWKRFYKSISNLLGVNADTAINKASLFHGYKDSKIYYNLNGSMVDVKPHIILAYESTPEKKVKPVKTAREFEISWDNRFETFEFAYNCDKNRSLTLYSAMRKACELGWEAHWVEELIEEINDSINRRLPDKRLHCITSQIYKFVN